LSERHRYFNLSSESEQLSELLNATTHLFGRKILINLDRATDDLTNRSSPRATKFSQLSLARQAPATSIESSGNKIFATVPCQTSACNREPMRSARGRSEKSVKLSPVDSAWLYQWFFGIQNCSCIAYEFFCLVKVTFNLLTQLHRDRITHWLSLIRWSLALLSKN